MKALVLFFSLMMSSTAFAESKSTEPFSVGIICRVCVKEKCQNYSELETAVVELIEKNGTPGTFVGELKLSYEVEGVKLTSVVQVSEFDFQGNHQINLFLETKEENNSTDLGSAEVIVKKLSELNSIAQYSVAIIRGDTQIQPVLLVGPSETAIQDKAKMLFR